MTEQEAISVLKNLAFLSTNQEHEKCENALELSIKALEKQIAKKPLVEYHCGLEKRCPTCNCEVSDIEHRKWSCKCGQKLDWE